MLTLDDPFPGMTMTMNELENAMYSSSPWNIKMVNYFPLGSYTS